ncbi:hypothetical protein QF034_006214 [Streptomyces africanus]|uniref:Uncharacterized protein n=1 Tax=Streptomyces africanus TaxID=231024 RepID=A0ABU0QX60_9ACTN|nr:hypothetical protein [Streptomyces africanus]
MSQKPVPLSGASPSPKVLVMKSRSAVRASATTSASSMPTRLVRCPVAVSRSAVAAANSSAFPVCEAHSTTTSRPAGSRAGAAGGAEREYMPARTPLTHRACSGVKGASGGSTGTPGAPEPSPARKPVRYWRSWADRTGGGEGWRPNGSVPAGVTVVGSRAPAGSSRTEPAASGPDASRTGVATFASDTAHTLNSGWNDSGSTASLVTALMLRYSPNRSFQWKGAKQQPGRTRSVTTAGSTARPRREATSTRSPSATPSASASHGWSSTNGPGFSLLSLATFPVLVSVCHWCCTRPVLSTKG